MKFEGELTAAEASQTTSAYEHITEPGESVGAAAR